jgi:hypothetical protein
MAMFHAFKYVLEITKDAHQVDHLRNAADGGKLESVMFLVEAGFRLTSDHLVGAARSGNPDLLRYVLQDYEGPDTLEPLMKPVMESGSHECVKFLFNKWYNPQSFTSGSHPALLAIKHGMLESFRYVVPRTPDPEPALLQELDLEAAVRGGPEMLQYLHQLGCEFDESATALAVRNGNLEALQYLHSIGAPWSVTTLALAVAVGSLQCLAFANTNGFPQDPSVVQDDWPVQPIAHKLEVLRYVCEHMDSTWAATVLRCTTTYLGGSVCLLKKAGWQFVAYLEQKWEGALPESLARFLAPRKRKRPPHLPGFSGRHGYWQKGRQMS